MTSLLDMSRRPKKYITKIITTGDRTVLPTANISKSNKGFHSLTMHRHSCSAKLEWYACKQGESTAMPKFCLSANISKSDIEEHVLTMHRHNCSTKLEWFACKKDSTTVRNEYHTDGVTYSNYGAVIDGILGACLLITVLAVLIVCKVRSKGLFTESNTHDYEDISRVNFSTTTYEDLDNTTHKSETATSNRTCDINESVAPVYEEVNEI